MDEGEEGWAVVAETGMTGYEEEDEEKLVTVESDSST